MPAECRVCNDPNQAAIEEVALLAMNGDISWQEVARRSEYSHPKGIQNHMDKHWVAPVSRKQEALSEFDTLVFDTLAELRSQWRIAPTEVKPFYAIAIQNLEALKDTKPSQQHLINALKAIHEVTGMKMEQRLMLDFAKAMFGQVGPGATEAIEKHTSVIDVEEVDGA